MTETSPPEAQARGYAPLRASFGNLSRSFDPRRAEPPKTSALSWVDGVLAPGQRRFEPAAAPEGAYDSLAFFEGSNHFEALLRHTLEQAAIEPTRDPLAAVLGCGSGVSAVSPCLRMFRGARIVAMDDRIGELSLLDAYLRDSELKDRVAIVAAPADQTVLRPGSLDLVLGVGVLHRLADPDRALAATAVALRPGGHAIFMEPFDGHGLIRLAFQRILMEAELRGEVLEPRLHAALADRIEDITARTRPDTAAPGFQDRSQKWLFARESIAAAAAGLGFARAQFFTHNDHPALYRDLAAARLAERMGVASVDLPAWAWAVLDEFDEALPPAVKRLLMVEGSVVLTR